MEIKCSFHPIYSKNTYSFEKQRVPEFRGGAGVLIRELGESTGKFVRRPVATTSAAGLRGLMDKISEVLIRPMKATLATYKNNIKHTYDHKVAFAIVEKELFGRNSIDSITHDLDKLILYTLGFPRKFVSKFHRSISEHHIESGKKPNLRSMVVDNIASELKEGMLSTRKYYAGSDDLQRVNGLGEIFERYNYGEDLDLAKIKEEQIAKYDSGLGLIKGLTKAVPVIFSTII